MRRHSKTTSRHFLVGLLCAAALSGCGAPAPCADGSCDFSPGSVDDPVLRMALDSPTTTTVQFTLSNPSSYALSEGLVTLAPLYTVDVAPSAALATYLSTPSVSGGAAALAVSRGLTIGVNAFIVPAVAAGGKASVAISVAPGAALSYLAKEIRPSGTDLVASYSPISWPNGSSGTFLTGFAVVNGKVTRGNNTVGATPSIAAIAFGLASASCASGGTMTLPVSLLNEDFSRGANDLTWPRNIGFDGDFNAEWVTDGAAARPLNPNWPNANPGAPALPLVTGFVKFFDLCPTGNATLSIALDAVTNQYTDPTSDTTLVLYYFNASGALLKVDTSYTLMKGNARRTALYDSVIPSTARRVALVPMARLGPSETQTVYFDNLTVDYEPSDAMTTTVLATDNFSNYSNSGSGNPKQPAGWTDYGGDWFVSGESNFLTHWNKSFGGGATSAYEAGTFKAFTFAPLSSSSVLTAKIFASATFTDPNSFVLLRARYLSANGALLGTVDSDRLRGSAFGNLDLRRVAIASGAASVQVVIVSSMGANERSSLLVDDLSVKVQSK